MRYILQVNTGSFSRCDVTADAVLRKLSSAIDTVSVSDVIFGWADHAELNQAICTFLKQRGIRSYLWLPVFSELKHPETAEPFVSDEGSGVASIALCKGESFDFVCPSSAANLQGAIRTFEELAQGCSPDGVFIDRIRYPSVANSLSALYGCRCERCLPHYHGAEQAAPSEPISRTGSRYRYRDAAFDAMMSAKRDIITEAVRELAKAFRAKGLLLGLDAFAPALSDFVGQDVFALAAEVDMLKPMMYRRTFAPAGVPFEFDAIRERCGDAVADGIERLWGGRLTDDGVNLRQIAELQGVKGNVSPGVDVNRIDPICLSDDAYARQSVLQAEEAGCRSVVLSWDLLRTDDRTLQALVP